MVDFKSTLTRYTDLMVVVVAILNVIKFVLLKDMAALKTIAGVSAVSFTAFAIYLNFLAPVVTPIVTKAVSHVTHAVTSNM
jgi:hypothetical protein